MIDSNTFTKEMLSNPSKLTMAMIDAMEQSDTGPVVQFNDPNNGFVMHSLATLHLFAKFSEKVDYVNQFFYRQRARTADQLYGHLSEFDFVKLMASPATLPFVFAMSTAWIRQNAVAFDSNYNKIQIPATSFITMGGITYSMYYPIDIFVNRVTGVISAFYNTSNTNSLFALQDNVLLDTVTYTQNGIEYYQMMFNMFQFERNTSQYTIGNEQGFIRSFTYDDQFYAVKVFSRNDDGSWNELAYSLSEMYYDYQKPTALISVLTDQSVVRVEIPQIYFDDNQISRTIRVEMYSSKGAVNFSLSPSDVNSIRANFDTGSSDFAASLAKMPTWIIIPATTEVAGGSNAMTFEEMRDAVVNGRLYERVAVTPPELLEAGRKAGFNLTRITDDLTDRIYFASNVLTDSSGMIVPTFTGSILLADDALEGNPDSIFKYTDGYYTVLPTTTFKISGTSLVCRPLSNGDIAAFSAMDKAAQVKEFNSGKYVRQPFHITLLTTAKSPTAAIYNLLSPTISHLTFIRENPNSAPQMSVIAYGIEHLANGTGGYRIRFSVQRSTVIEKEPLDNFQVTLTCKTKIGDDVYLPATFIGLDNNGNDLWEVLLSTNYHITVDNQLTVAMYNSGGTSNYVEIPLLHQMTILTSFSSSYDNTIPTDSILNALLPAPMAGSHVVMTQQTIDVNLGQNLSDQIYCGVNTSWGTDTYDVITDTVYYITNSPIFQHNESGVIETSWNASTKVMSVVQLYGIGETPSATGDFSTYLSADYVVAGGQAVLAVTDTTGVLVGMAVRGTDIPINSTVVAKTTTTITISNPITVPLLKGLEITFGNPDFMMRTTAAQTALGTDLNVADTTGILVGQSVFGFGIDAGSVVQSIVSPTVIRLSKPTTTIVANNTLLTIINKTAHGVVKFQQGDVRRDSNGNPIVLVSAKNQYRIPAILFDSRLFASDDPLDQAIVPILSQRLQNYANQIATIDAGLLEDSDVFYTPARTMGQATFGVGDGVQKELSLELSFKFRVYVDAAVYNTSTVLSSMTSSIYKIVNEEIQKDVIVVSEIASTIRDKLGTDVFAVEADGINGDPDLRLIALESSGCTPSIENKLTLQPDGSTTRGPNISVVYIPKPETVDSIILNRI